ncbi:hypothetical protein TSH58p_13405 [Azospirillum sp. TSH58]|uniref:HupE/UreJ family protein n=1 Tax=Azospirillum sp. TSH58 TaxID=664962 RepID=UPI000D600686|nr:HupE/UreJ family protein [Azospirillum sp. TSH58]AWJ84435.1 hypothetical protein TSH58p_13405 [Azospirillum sp. TSH58]PWC68922.1 hypothetical protein TSH58_16160 [Azospirillum sp. TSH58]
MVAIRSVLLALVLAAVGVGAGAAPALARMTVTGPFGTGLTEPVWVLQHLLGFLAIGLWSGQNGGPSVWQLPVAALTAVLAAGLAAQIGIRLPYAAEGLSASLILMGGLVAFGLKAPLALGVLTVAAAGAFHGYVHMGGPLFWAGLSSGVLLVICAGLGLSAVLGQAASGRVVQMCGGAVALAGVLDLAGVF